MPKELIRSLSDHFQGLSALFESRSASQDDLTFEPSTVQTTLERLQAWDKESIPDEGKNDILKYRIRERLMHDWRAKIAQISFDDIRDVDAQERELSFIAVQALSRLKPVEPTPHGYQATGSGTHAWTVEEADKAAIRIVRVLRNHFLGPTNTEVEIMAYRETLCHSCQTVDPEGSPTLDKRKLQYNVIYAFERHYQTKPQNSVEMSWMPYMDMDSIIRTFPERRAELRRAKAEFEEFLESDQRSSVMNDRSEEGREQSEPSTKTQALEQAAQTFTDLIFNDLCLTFTKMK